MSSFDTHSRFAPHSGFDHPGRARRLTGAVATAAVLATGTVLWLTPTPVELGGYHLAGARGPGCTELIVLQDESGSMSDYAPQRATALAELQTWAAHNLNDDDRIAVIDWANTARIALPVTPIKQTTAPALIDPADLGGGTLVTPALQEIGQLQASACRTHLLVLSDGEISDVLNPAATRTRLAALRVDTVTLFDPAAGTAPPEWAQSFPYSTTVPIDFSNTVDLTYRLGQAVAAATGQQLVAN